MAEYATVELELNLENVEAWNGEQRPLVPAGSYTVKVTGIEQKSGKGKSMIAATFEIVGGANGEDVGDLVGSKVWNNYMLGNDTGLKRLKSLMVACGANLARFNSDDLMGATIDVDVVHTQGQGGVDENGNVREPRTFANVINERALPSEEDGAGAQPEPPPITRSQGGAQGGAQSGTPAKRQARRA